jgi:hypothetical protein
MRVRSDNKGEIVKTSSVKKQMRLIEPVCNSTFAGRFMKTGLIVKKKD